MTDAVTLPYTITRGAQMRLIVPAMLASPLIIDAILYALVISLPPEQGEQMLFMFYVLMALIPMQGIVIWVLLKAVQPATLTIYPSFITVKPLPILGFSVVTAQEHRLVDFKTALLQTTERKEYVALSLVRQAFGKPLLLSGSIERGVAEQLAAKLGLPVEKI